MLGYGNCSIMKQQVYRPYRPLEKNVRKERITFNGILDCMGRKVNIKVYTLFAFVKLYLIFKTCVMSERPKGGNPHWSFMIKYLYRVPRFVQNLIGAAVSN